MKYLACALTSISIAYWLISVCDRYDAPVYYAATGLVYGLVSGISAILAIICGSKLLHLYSVCNLFAAFISLLIVNPSAYHALSGVFWHWPVNLSLITEAVELMLVLRGIGVAAIFIFNSYASDSFCSKNSVNKLAVIK